MSFWEVTKQLADGFGVTLMIFGITLAASLPLGLIITFGSMSKIPPVKWIVKVFVWIIRGTPLMLQI
ncbi:MAG: ABC transporter permease subunit, partial [Oscillospiraceae bacterium]|nr:ABC transporter permease subunit [Oscillospiraceae bacterium]